jgi:hypothetical protein
MSKGNGMSTYTKEMLDKHLSPTTPVSAGYPSDTKDPTRNNKHHLEGNGIITKDK